MGMMPEKVREKAAHLGIVERGLVEVLEGLRNEETRAAGGRSGLRDRRARGGKRMDTHSGRTQRSIRRTMALFSAGVCRVHASQSQVRDTVEEVTTHNLSLLRRLDVLGLPNIVFVFLLDDLLDRCKLAVPRRRFLIVERARVGRGCFAGVGALKRREAHGGRVERHLG